MKITTKCIGSSIIIVGLIAAIQIGYDSWSSHQDFIAQEKQEITNASLKTVTDLHNLLVSQIGSLKDFILLDEERASLENYQSSLWQFQNTLNQLEKLQPDLASEMVLVRRRYDSLVRLGTDLINNPKTSKSTDLSDFQQDFRVINSYNRDILIYLDTLTTKLGEQEAQARHELEEVRLYGKITRQIILILILSIFVAQFLLIFIPVIRSIQKLKVGANKMGVGDLDYRLDIQTGDEIQDLAFEFNKMGAKLAETYHDLEHKKQVADDANHAKSEFLANMSHELRTPLNGILGYAQILMRDKDLPETQRNGLAIIQQCGSHLLTLINDILDLSKIEAKKMELRPNEFNFMGFLQTIREICRIKAEQKGITFISQFDPALPVSVQADEKRLRQVLINLLGNAVKFTDTGDVTFKVGVIDSSTIEPEANTFNSLAKIRFQIEDTGVGMSEEQMQKIFTPFEQVGDIKRMAEGTGLGLAISSKIVQQMGSQVRVTSQLGAGSKFWFDLDLPCTSELALKPTFELPGTIVGFTGNKRKILVVDDRWENRSVIINLLTPVGFEVFEATNGAEGLEKVNELKPDAIITDLVMPIMDGFELLRRLRNSDQLKELIVIVSSASVFETDQYKSLDAGANAFLPKPVQVSELFELLQRLLDLSWIYAESSPSEPTPLSNSPVSFVESLVIPPPEVIEALYVLARQGNLQEMMSQAEDLKKLDEQWIPFGEKLYTLAKGFEVKKLQAFLTQYKTESTLSPPTNQSSSQISSVESLVIPPPEIIDALYDLVKKGKLRAIIQQAEELKNLDEQWIPFAEKVCTFAKGFEEKKLQAFLTQYKKVESIS
jgi:signal transduction histidine kinase/CheY-like chemotaxis protein